MAYMRDKTGRRLDDMVLGENRKLRPVASGVHLPVRNGAGMNVSDGVSTGVTTQMEHPIHVNARGVRLAFSNWYNVAGTVTDGPNAITVKASLRQAGGIVYPVFFRGARSVTIDPGATVLSDPIGVNVKDGETFYSRTYVSVTAGGRYPLGTKTSNSTGSEGVAAGDLTGAMDSVPSNSTYGYAPWAILGTPTTPTRSPIVLTVGDSITVGYGEARGSSDSYGWTRRAFDGALSLVNVAVSGSGIIAADTRGELATRIAQADLVDCDTAVVLYGTNDLAGGSTSAAVQAALGNLYAILIDRGLTVYGATIPPITTTTDAWATVENQTVVASNANRLAVNAWIRSAPAPLSGFYDFADAVESARDSGKWKAAHTGDGTHPNAAGYTAMAATITPSTLGPVL